MEGILGNFERENNKKVKQKFISHRDKNEQLNLNKIENPKNKISKFINLLLTYIIFWFIMIQ
jgi:hypothetical protein